MSSTPLERAEHAEAVAREAAFRERTLPSLDRLIRAVRRRDAEIVRSLHAARISTEYVGDLLDPAIANVPHQPSAPADACQFHAPAGDPCAADGCGHAAGADCHPRRT